MSKLLAACAGLVATLVIAAPARAADSDCKLRKITQLPAFLSADNHLMVGGKINGKDVLFRVDTSTYMSVLFQGSVARFGLQTHWTGNEALVTTDNRSVTDPNRHGITDFKQTMDGRRLDTLTTIDALTLGGDTFKNVEFEVAPAAPSAQQEAGILGAAYLRSYDVEIDLADGAINLFDKDHCPGKVVYWAPSYSVTPFKLDDMELSVELDGTQMRALVATDEPQTLLTLADANTSFGLKSDSPGMKRQPDRMMTSGFSLPFYTYGFHALKFGELTLHNPVVSVLDMRPEATAAISRVPAAKNRPVWVGQNVLSHLRMFISYGEHNLYYTVEPKPPARSLPQVATQ